MNPLLALQDYGQSVWLDYMQRHLITSGELQRLIEGDGLRGMTSNPAIFEKAISGSTDYIEALRALTARHLDAMGLYEQLAIGDIQDAADIFRPVYEQTRRGDGYISLEVSPHLAHDTRGTIREARRLWQTVGRPNLMIKVPGTPAGLPAIEQLISEGINVNVTLLFSQEVYERVAEAYITGLERLAAQRGHVGEVASVASFFISRIDTATDTQVIARLKAAQSAQERTLLRSLLGHVAIANGKLTYQRYKAIFQGARWETLSAMGARPQRVLWASTSTKNPKYRDVLYVEELIGPNTVNTMPLATLEAFRDHGRVHPTLEEDLDVAHDTMEVLAQMNISMQGVTEQLLDEGVRLFAEPFDKLLDTLAHHGA
jgi:transaldolase / glucose-6-phosphate isomerase